MKSAFKVRETAPRDYEGVKRLLIETGMVGKFPKATFSRILDRNRRYCLVAAAKGKVVGSVFGFDDVLTLHISKLAVDESYRRQGVGRLIMKELMRRSKKPGFDYIFLHVRKKNKGAVALYRSLGFKYRNMVFHFMDI